MSLLDPSGEIQAYPFPYKINFSDFHCLFNLSWYQIGRGREESFNSSKCFSALVKVSPCGKFKNFRTNKAILTIVIGLKNILRWNLVKSALDKKDKSVPVYSPLLNFSFVDSVCNVFEKKNLYLSRHVRRKRKKVQSNELTSICHKIHLSETFFICLYSFYLPFLISFY